ncbi:MAG: restriction endonuclease subunit S [Candidatus Gastranaerophilales bacterium]|nr:restriction endonuclease subunit S [Candidatus Gastranaerophilales bacterium]
MKKYKPYDEYKETDLPWLAKIPDQWSVIRSGYLFQEVVDTGHPELELLSIMMDRGIIKQSDSGRKTRASEDRSLYKKIKSGQLGYNLMNAFMGSIGISKYDGILSPAYAVGKPRLPMNPWFYQYLYKTPLYKVIFDWYSYGIMYERNRLYFDNFKRIPAPYPSLKEQNKIVDFIKLKEKQIKQFIRNKKKLIKLLNEQKQGIINYAVTKGLDPNVAFKSSGVDWLGDIPKHWEICKLRRVCKYVKTGGTPAGVDEKYYSEEGFNWYTPGDFKDDIYLVNSARQLSELGKRLVQKFPPGTVMMVGIGSIGKASITKTEVSCNQQINGIVLTDKLVPEFLVYYLRANSNYIISCGKSTTLPIINQEETKNLIMLLPDLIEQKEIVNFINLEINKINIIISRTIWEIELLQEYCTRLISDVVTGKIDVRDIPVNEMDLEITDIEEELENIDESENLEDTENIEVEYA